MDYSEIINDISKFTTGTTTVGIRCVDGVILATDRRATAEYLVASRNAQKIYILDDHLAATIAGAVADAQNIMDIVTAEAKLYKIRSGKPIPVQSASRLLSNILFQSRQLPYILQLIIGGFDYTGARLFVLDLFGSLTEEKFTSTGSGSPIALGVLENGYFENIKVEEAIALAVHAVNSAINRDVGSGDGVDVVKITSKGVEKIPQNEVNKYVTRIV
ncbi:MAG: archaeal proteasome endopeptidase complex subunit beta [Candidatus Odinarchaeum yellowstonii]|uniref:Proteasome subunit beta n=1 Tax=Odinarchaeota yellowstonii (strain LCB_4) TaxID=1841599 RepID=A0AAF0D372_ODILC|nr:MAG: archaeal proteasome endopeptidase complex subunit beta [Candidatus Odinarchaeum yellowstonii]